jgi:hypothetical protein
MAQALTDRQWVCDISGALSVTTLVEYLHLWDRLALVQLNTREDVIRWRWTMDRRYNAHSAYLLMHQGITAFPGAAQLWKPCGIPCELNYSCGLLAGVGCGLSIMLPGGGDH